MVLLCNGKKIEVHAGTTLLAFIESKDLNPDTVVAQCDGVVIKRDDYDGYVLNQGCTLELIRFVGGG